MWIRWVKNSLPNSGVLAVEGLPWNLKKSTFRKKVEALMVLIYPINKHKVPIIRKRQRKSKWVQKGLAEWSSIQLSTFFFFLMKAYLFIYLFIYFWLCWVFVSVPGLSLVAASGGHSSSRCAGLSPSWPLLLRSTSSRRAGSVVVAHGPSCSATCGIFPDQGSNLCRLHWQADSQQLRHQGSPSWAHFKEVIRIFP